MTDPSGRVNRQLLSGADPRAPLPDAARIAQAVRSVPAVAALSAGRYGEIVTYHVGSRTLGVRVRPGFVDVHVVIRCAANGEVPPLLALAEQIRIAVHAVEPGVDVDVSFDDLLEDGPTDGGAGAP